MLWAPDVISSGTVTELSLQQVSLEHTHHTLHIELSDHAYLYRTTEWPQMPLLGVATYLQWRSWPHPVVYRMHKGEWPASLRPGAVSLIRNLAAQISPTPLWSRAWRVTYIHSKLADFVLSSTVTDSYGHYGQRYIQWNWLQWVSIIL